MRVPALGMKMLTLLVLIVGMAPARLGAQRVSEMRLGVGLTTTDRVIGWGQHAIAEFAIPLGRRVTLRSAGFLSFGRELSVDRRFSEGLDLNAVVSGLGDRIRPYCGVGLGYTHPSLSEGRPFRQGLGVGGVVGIELSRGGWFAEARLRYFGNVFFKEAPTESFHLITLGRRVRTW